VRQIALVTYSGYPELTDDDRLLVPSLRHLGVEAVPVVWIHRLTGPGLIRSFSDPAGTITLE